MFRRFKNGTPNCIKQGKTVVDGSLTVQETFNCRETVCTEFFQETQQIFGIKCVDNELEQYLKKKKS